MPRKDIPKAGHVFRRDEPNHPRSGFPQKPKHLTFWKLGVGTWSDYRYGRRESRC